jgi:hypothetical protein
VLSDGVGKWSNDPLSGLTSVIAAWMTKNIKPTHLVDMATLTGAQMIATGMQHAALLSNDEAFERVVYDAGRVLLPRACISLTFK